ncbi:IS110 family RNA-guided transposase [Roseicella aquatilis]|uniref:IS110 family transposase n=1 Tax=Roseicella aquatilis TaxID=2527868 RepID=A0A4R4DKF3_9PROT|nr:IS110 family transposase [Roseicella aquatilis]TCZ61099.1 IS110 family transposase [Roseicella aquatilis]
MDAITIGLDIAKSSFQVHGVDASGAVVVRRKLARGKVLEFFRGLPSAVVGIEACGGAQHWARQIAALGHRVRLLPARAVKAYVARQKNDAADAAAICEAAGRAVVREVPVKTVEAQAGLALLRVREVLVKQRTMLVNALRGHLAEFGVVAPRGREGVSALAERLSDPAVPALAQAACAALVAQVKALEAQILALEARLRQRHAADPASQRLAAIPGIGLLGATALALGTEPGRFDSGRDYAASLGAVPRQHSTGGRERLGSISRMGDSRVRGMLTAGASAVLKQLSPREGQPPAALAHSALGAWALRLLARKPWRVVMVALANKLARIAWAVLTRGTAYHPAGRPGPAAA